jgi:hypothetical protein
VTAPSGQEPTFSPPPTTGPCEHCGATMVLVRYWKRHRFCSSRCAARSQFGCLDTAEEYLRAYVDRSGGPDACWLWTRSRGGRGGHERRYGHLQVNGKLAYTHRLAYELAFGPIPEGLLVLHRCDNPPCCNPAHLFVGTSADNTADRIAKGRPTRLSTPDHLRVCRWCGRSCLKSKKPQECEACQKCASRWGRDAEGRPRSKGRRRVLGA